MWCNYTKLYLNQNLWRKGRKPTLARPVSDRDHEWVISGGSGKINYKCLNMQTNHSKNKIHCWIFSGVKIAPYVSWIGFIHRYYSARWAHTQIKTFIFHMKVIHIDRKIFKIHWHTCMSDQVWWLMNTETPNLINLIW